MKYFNYKDSIYDDNGNDITLEKIKKQFHELCLVLHPDQGGRHSDFILMYQEYTEILKSLNGKQFTTKSTQREYTYYYNEELEKDIFKKIDETLSKKMLAVKIYLVGEWIWCLGNTKLYRQELKELGYRFSVDKKSWYWRSDKKRYFRPKQAQSLDTIFNNYGFKEYANDNKELLPLTA